MNQGSGVRDQGSELTPLEKYLAGVPLNPELAALKDGRTEEPGAAQETLRRAPVEEPDRELTTAERMDLREMRILPGWPILARLLEKTCRIHEKAAIILAQGDPLKDRDAIAEAFGYAKMYRRAKGELELMVDAELAELELEQRKEKGTGE